MFRSLKRRKIMRQRVEAAAERQAAAKAFAAALVEAEEAFAALRFANDKFYRSNESGEQAILSALRRERERVFVFHVHAHVVRRTPNLARLFQIKIQRAAPVGLAEWIQRTTEQDLRAIGAAEEPMSPPKETQDAEAETLRHQVSAP